MRKRILSILLCLCMALTLLPTTAMAAELGTKDTIAAGLASCTDAGDTFTVSDVTYTYGGDVSYTDLTTPPTVVTVYRAGAGSIVFTPASSDGEIPATMTMHGAVTIMSNATLDLSGCGTIANNGTITNDGLLKLPTNTDPNTIGITGVGTVQVGEVCYKYLNGTWVLSVPLAGLDLAANCPTEETVWQAGSGTVTYTPAVDATHATLVFDGATVFPISDTAINLPSGAAVDVIFRGENAISAFSSFDAVAFRVATATSFTLEAGSRTTLTANSKSAHVIDAADGAGEINITGLGTLVFAPKTSSSSKEDCYAIYAPDTTVNIHGGSVYELRSTSGSVNSNTSGTGGIVEAEVTLKAVTIPKAGTLDLHSATLASTEDVVNNGMLLLPTGTGVDALDITGSGIVKIGDSYYKNVNGTWVQDITNTGLDYGYVPVPETETTYAAGEGTVTFTPASGTSIAALTLNNATIAPSSQNGNSVPPIRLVGMPVTLVLHGSSYLKGAGSDTDRGAVNADDDMTIAGDGSLLLEGSDALLAKNLTLTDSVTVTSAGGTVDSIALGTGSTLNAILSVSGTPTVYGKYTVAKDSEKSFTDVLSWDDGASIEVNGKLSLASGTDIHAIQDKLSGSGIVRVVKEMSGIFVTKWEAFLADGTPIPYRTKQLNFTADGGWEAGATLAEDGYTFTGSAEAGYVVTLGDLIIDYEFADAPAIVLPGDGKVTVKLVGDTRVIAGGQAMVFSKDLLASASPCTISGSGSLALTTNYNSAVAVLSSAQPLTIAGGTISVTNNSVSGITPPPSVDAGDLTITGGRITVSASGKAFSSLPNFINFIPKVICGAEKDSAKTKYAPSDDVYTTNQYVEIQKYVARSSYTITAAAGAGGRFTTGKTASVVAGGSVHFAIAADKGFAIADVKVDGVSVGAVSAYTFTSIFANHTITATFKKLDAEAKDEQSAAVEPEKDETATPTETPAPQTPEVPAETVPTEPAADAAQESGSVLPYVLGGIGAVAAAAVVLVLIKRKKVN